MPATAYGVPQTQIGIGIETVRGTPASTLFWLPVKAPKYKPELTVIADDTLQGSMVSTYDMVPGLRYDGHGWDSYPYLDSFPVLVRALLGSTDTTTAAAAGTTLSSAADAGSPTISTAASLAAGDWVTLGSGGTLEAHRVASVSSDIATLDYPLRFAHASGQAVTGLTGHTFSVLNNAGSGNQPPSCTILDYDGEEWRQLTSGQLDKLTIKGNATGLVDYTVSWFADPATTPSAPSVSYATDRAVPGWSTQAMIGSDAVNYIVDWEIDLERSVKPIPALTGTQAYFMYFADALKATGKLTVVEQAGAPELTEYLSGEQQALDLLVQDIASGFALRLHSTKTVFNTGEIDRGSEYVQAKLDFTCLPSASDATAGGVSPIQVEVANSQTTSY